MSWKGGLVNEPPPPRHYVTAFASVDSIPCELSGEHGDPRDKPISEQVYPPAAAVTAVLGVCERISWCGLS